MFIIKHKSSFADLKLFALKVRRLLKRPQDLSLIFFLAPSCITTAISKLLQKKKVLTVQLQGSSQPLRAACLTAGPAPQGPQGTSRGLKGLCQWQQPRLLGQQHAGSPATARGWERPPIFCFGIKKKSKQVAQKLLSAASSSCAGQEQRADRVRAMCSSSSAHAR